MAAGQKITAAMTNFLSFRKDLIENFDCIIKRKDIASKVSVISEEECLKGGLQPEQFNNLKTTCLKYLKKMLAQYQDFEKDLISMNPNYISSNSHLQSVTQDIKEAAEVTRLQLEYLSNIHVLPANASMTETPEFHFE